MTTVTYRPNGAGSNTNISYQEGTSGSHYDKVDEVNFDGSTYVWTLSTSYQLDTYAFANPAEGGSINNITVYARCTADEGTGSTKIAIYTSGQTANYGAEEALTEYWDAYSNTWSTNPWTSAAWTWSDLNALEIGIALKKGTAINVACTQVYIVIDYTAVAGGSYAVVLGL